MEIFKLEQDINVMCLTAKSFPEGVHDVHEDLKTLVPNSDQRLFFGISRPDKNHQIIYKAATETKTPNKAQTLNIETFTISKGSFYCITLINYYKDIPNVESTFKKLLSQPNIDPYGYCLEWYLNGGRDMRCMVKLKL